MFNPIVTVIMPVYNGEQYLHEAIDSILKQSFTNYEFLIINDGSYDNSVSIINSYNDKRIRLIHNMKNIGLIASLNKGIELSRGKYIARMDCDDISLPDRLLTQINFMEHHQETGLCGTWVNCFNINKNNIKIYKLPVDSNTIRCELLFTSPVVHPTVVMSRDLIIQNKLYYDNNFIHAEDYELWTRFIKYASLNNLSKPLLIYRLHSNQICSVFSCKQQDSSDLVRIKQLENLKIIATKEQFEIHKLLCLYNLIRNFDLPPEILIYKINEWVLTLKQANYNVGYYPEPFFSKVLSEHVYVILSYILNNDLLFDCLFNSRYVFNIILNWYQKIKLIIKILLKENKYYFIKI